MAKNWTTGGQLPPLPPGLLAAMLALQGGTMTSRSKTPRSSTLIAAVLVPLLALAAGCDPGGGQGLMNEPGVPGLDVGGLTGATWRVTFQDPIRVTVKGAAGTVSAADLQMGGGQFKVGEATIELKGLCGRQDFVCPQHVFPLEVTMTQSDELLHMLRVTVNPRGPLRLLPQPALLGNVDSRHAFAVLLGAGVAGMGNCGLLGLSTARGTITPDPKDPKRGVALSGKVLVSYTGACVVLGNTVGATGAGLDVDLEVPFSAARL
jgi:hypothetical protein